MIILSKNKIAIIFLISYLLINLSKAHSEISSSNKSEISLNNDSLNIEKNEIINKGNSQNNFYFYPKSYGLGEYKFISGFSVTRLPNQVVEEEISYSPMPFINFQIGISEKWLMSLKFNSNYISNHGSIGFEWTNNSKEFAYSFGANTEAWFGHLVLDEIKLKTWGLIFSPYVNVGYPIDDILFSIQIESQNHIFWTYSENELLGIIRKLNGGFALQFSVEQPFWNENYVALALKLNYAKFYYQSWLSYSTVDEYLLYPEFIFGFIF